MPHYILGHKNQYPYEDILDGSIFLTKEIWKILKNAIHNKGWKEFLFELAKKKDCPTDIWKTIKSTCEIDLYDCALIILGTKNTSIQKAVLKDILEKLPLVMERNTRCHNYKFMTTQHTLITLMKYFFENKNEELAQKIWDQVPSIVIRNGRHTPNFHEHYHPHFELLKVVQKTVMEEEIIQAIHQYRDRLDDTEKSQYKVLSFKEKDKGFETAKQNYTKVVCYKLNWRGFDKVCNLIELGQRHALITCIMKGSSEESEIEKNIQKFNTALSPAELKIYNKGLNDLMYREMDIDYDLLEKEREVDFIDESMEDLTTSQPSLN